MPRLRSITLHRALRGIHRERHLRGGQAGEIAAFEDPGQTGLFLRQAYQGSIDGEDRFRLSLDGCLLLVEGFCSLAAPALGSALAAVVGALLSLLSAFFAFRWSQPQPLFTQGETPSETERNEIRELAKGLF